MKKKKKEMSEAEQLKILKRVVRRIAYLDHAPNCPTPSCPLGECSCVPDPTYLAQDALGNIGEWDKKWSEYR